MKHKLEIVRLDPRRYEDLSYLLSKIFKVKRSIKYLEQKYSSHGDLPSNCGFFAYINDKPISFCGGIPCNMRYKGLEFSGMQFVDVMTVREYTGQGIFSRLAQTLEQFAIDQNINFLFGFTTDQSYWPFVKKLRWESPHRMLRYSLSCNSFSIKQILHYVLPTSFNADIFINNKFEPERFLHSAATASEEHAGCFVLPHVGHYENLPKNHYLIDVDGSGVWIKIDRTTAHVGDIVFKEGTNYQKFIGELYKLISKLGLRKLHFQISAGAEVQQKLAPYWKGEFSWHVIAKSHDRRIPTSALKLVYGNVDTFI